jgi:hypothetical protein
MALRRTLVRAEGVRELPAPRAGGRVVDRRSRGRRQAARLSQHLPASRLPALRRAERRRTQDRLPVSPVVVRPRRVAARMRRRRRRARDRPRRSAARGGSRGGGRGARLRLDGRGPAAVRAGTLRPGADARAPGGCRSEGRGPSPVRRFAQTGSSSGRTTASAGTATSATRSMSAPTTTRHATRRPPAPSLPPAHARCATAGSKSTTPRSASRPFRRRAGGGRRTARRTCRASSRSRSTACRSRRRWEATGGTTWAPSASASCPGSGATRAPTTR